VSKGYVSIHRELFDHWVWKDKPFSRGQAWIDLILMANHCDSKIMFDGRFVEVGRGDIITSSVKLSERWGWSRNKVSLFLKNLESDQMVITKTDSKKTALTICNYSDWQDSQTAKEQQKDSRKTAEGQQKDTINNVNNSNNEKEVKHMSVFEAWQSEKIHIHKGISKAIEQQLNKLTAHQAEEVITAIKNYAKAFRDSNYYYNNVWTLDTFIKQSNGYKQWLDEGKMWVDYTSRTGNKKPEQAPVSKPQMIGVLPAKPLTVEIIPEW